MFDIQENLKNLPNKPGVYLHKDKLGQVIYVGKAISLKNRVRQYFQSSRNMDAKVRAMVKNIEEFEYITCGSEMEALILENNLIKKYMPKYNVLLRDDKTYPYIKITAEKWPRIQKVRQLTKDGSKYFGPYTDVKAVNQMVEFLNQVYKVKRCSLQDVQEGFKPCLNYHIGQCDGMCAGHGDIERYKQRIDEAEMFLKGKQSNLIDNLKRQMDEAAFNMEFEKAAIFRDNIAAAQALLEKQRVVLAHTKHTDLVLYAGKGKIVVFFVRDGKLSGRETFSLEIEMDDGEAEVIGAFVKQYYGKMTNGPSEILLVREIADKKLLEDFLTECWNKKVSINIPKKGEKRAFLEMAKRDAAEVSKLIEDKEKNKKEREEKIRVQLEKVIDNGRVGEDTIEALNPETGEIISLKNKEENGTYRVEAYDISNTNGVDNIGAMVVFEGLRPNKKAYRRFKIKYVLGQDDYGAMQEIIMRRVKRALSGDKGFLPLPDIMLLDGGKGHVETIRKALGKMGVEIPVVGMVKDDSHRTRALTYPKGSKGWQQGDGEEDLKSNSMLFKYIGNIQEEVHRFAIEYHKGLRGKNMTRSALDDIPGIGEKKRNALLKQFKGVEGIKKATREDLEKTEGISKTNAKEIIKFFVDKNEDE